MPKIFLVGGACRDKLLGREPKDTDFVVVGADIPWMLSQGFKQVGASFPVFLHPETGDEYALARREKKVGVGYKGFEFEFGPHVTLEDDLIRRDLTINSIAFDQETGEFIDPFGGQHDLAQGIIRHTSEAFAEDPLRVLRVARFAARYKFKVADDTVDLCRHLVDQGEIDALSADRIWMELEKLMSEDQPSIGIEFLTKVGALKTQRLKLVRPVNFKAIFSDSFEASLNLREKMFFLINTEQSSKELDEQRIPLNVSRTGAFFTEIFEILMSHMGDDECAECIVKFFDRFRAEIRSGRLAEVKELLHKMVTHDDVFQSKQFFEHIVFACDQLLKLDFTELTRGMKPQDIKSFVLDFKIKTVKASCEMFECKP